MIIITKGGPSEGSLDVQIDGVTQNFTDFVAVGYDDLTGKTTLLQNTDTVTLGRAYQMLAIEFSKSYNELDEEMKALVDKELEVKIA